MRFLMLIANSFLGLPSRGCVPRNLKCGVLARPGVGIVAILLFGLSACASYDRGIEAQGGINGHEIATTVDTPEAKYYLESYLEGLGGDPKLEAALDQALAKLSPSRIDTEEFQVLAANFSRDLAALHLIKRLSEIPENARIQATYWREIEGLRALTGGKGASLEFCKVEAKQPLFIFVPGWLYRTNSETGADFARPRRLLTALGFETQLIATEENGSIEVNSEIVADHIRRAGLDAGPVILISTSKSGPEAAHALGHLLTTEESAAVKAWINVGGLLKGSPLADWGNDWPNSWLVGFYFALKNLDISKSLASMTSTRSLTRWQKETIPGHISVVNFVAVPLSGDITPGAEFGYARASHAGPTDGLTAIVDELAHGGATVIEVGLDHYYRDPEIHLKTVALSLTVVRDAIGPVEIDCPASDPLPDNAVIAQTAMNFPSTSRSLKP